MGTLFAIIGFLRSPIGKWVGGLALIAILAGGIYVKGRSDGSTAMQAKVERQQKRAITIATKAREHLQEACERNPKNCVPDFWFREDDE